MLAGGRGQVKPRSVSELTVCYNPPVIHNQQQNTAVGPRLPGVRTILVFAMNLLGDSICRLPAVAAAKSTYQGSRVIVVADPRYREVFEGQPFIDEVWVLDRTGPRARQTGAWLALLMRARRAPPDLVLDLYGSSRTALVSWLTGARWRAGLHRGGMSRWYNLRRRVRRAGASSPATSGSGQDTQVLPYKHIVQHINAAVAPAGIAAEFRYQPIAVEPALRSGVASKASHRSNPDEGSIGEEEEHRIILNPSARVSAKRWSADRFGQVAKAVSAANGPRCAVITAPGEEALTERVVAASDGSAVALPVLTIRELAAVLQSARLIVTGDTGVLHLATAMGTRSVILAGPTDPTLVACPHVLQVALFRREACPDWVGEEQCVKYNDCDERTCIDTITVDEVVSAALTLLARP